MYALDFMACLSRINGAFDIVFIDPPYRYTYGEIAVREIIGCGLLSNNGVIVYERTEPFDGSRDTNIEVADVRKYGKTYISLLRRKSGNAAAAEGIIKR